MTKNTDKKADTMTAESIKTKYEGIVKERAKLVNTYAKALEELDAKKTVLQADESKAIDSPNPDDFLKVREEIRKIDDLHDYYQNKLKAVQGKTFTDEQRNELLTAVKTEIARLESGLLDAVIPTIIEAKEKSIATKTEIIELCDILDRLNLDRGIEQHATPSDRVMNLVRILHDRALSIAIDLYQKGGE